MRPQDSEKFDRWMNFIYKTVYHEPDTPKFHQVLIDKVIHDIVLPLDLDKDCTVYDIGCGSGYFMEKMREEGYANLTGLTMDDDDIAICNSKQLTALKQDFTFSDLASDSADLIFCRQAIEHSMFPMLTLLEFNRIAKLGSKIYIEVPAPDMDRKHEDNLNHFSIMGLKMWKALFDRAGFFVDYAEPYDFGITDEIASGIFVDQKERFYVCLLTKTADIMTRDPNIININNI